MPVSIVRPFPMQARATVVLGEDLGGRTLTIQGSGSMSLAFEPTPDPDILTVLLKDINLTFDRFDLPWPTEEQLGIEGLRVQTSDFDLAASTGTLNRRTEEFALTLVFLLSPTNIPQLTTLGVRRPIQIVAVEQGRLNLATGYLETHARPFTLGPGPLGSVTVMGGQFSSCSTEIRRFCATPAEAPADPQTGNFGCQGEIWICPGEAAILYWEATPDVTSAHIDPGVGSVPVPSGSVTVNPVADTQYTLTVEGDCERQRHVTVHVVEPGDVFLLSALFIGNGLWQATVPPQLASSSIFVTSIKSAPCISGQNFWADWSCQKIEPDGSTLYFNVTAIPTSPATMHLVGQWTFSPLGVPAGSAFGTGNACFVLTLSCE